MAEIITVSDLPAALQSAELVQVMVDGANAHATRVAPCLTPVVLEDESVVSPTLDQLAEARLVLIGAIKRWVEAGSGAWSTQAAGPFSIGIDTRPKSPGFRLWPSEIEQLQDICKGEAAGSFSVDTAPGLGGMHLPWCSINFGAAYCSCGVDIAGEPIFELG